MNGTDIEKVSVVIPVYNSARYLRKAIESVLCQTYRNYEVVLVDDGSTDSSGEICDEYAQHDGRIRCFHRRNHGVSSSRNFALDKIEGDCLYFMDSDDELSPFFLQTMMGGIMHGYDMVVCGYRTFYRSAKIEDVIKDADWRAIDSFFQLDGLGAATSVCNKVVRLTEKSRRIRFDEEMTFGEDAFFAWKCCLVSQSVAYTELPLYYYRQGRSGATTRWHPNLYSHYRNSYDDLLSYALNLGIDHDCFYEKLCVHFAKRLPSLTKMEVLSPYNTKEKMIRLMEILNDEYIQFGLSRLDGRESKDVFFRWAKEKKVKSMFLQIKKQLIKQYALYPIKWFCK